MPLVAAAFLVPCTSALAATNLCTVIADARSGHVLLETGNCDSRVTPASTFKIPLATMGFDYGFLIDPAAPSLPFVRGYAEWGGDAWRRDTDPAHWMRESVVWYSQQIAQALGVARLTAYATDMGYGNADFAGDPGQNNALERAWISSSLKISPREQIAFLRRLLARTLPVSPEAMDNTIRIVESHSLGDGWTVWGKTGSAYPRNADGTFARNRGWGWYVGWAAQGDRVLVFARLTQDDGTGGGGRLTRERFLAEWQELVRALL